MRTAVLTALLALGFAVSPVFAAGSGNTNVTVDSGDLNGALDTQREKEDRFGIPIDDATALEINEDGDPAVSRRF